MLAARSRITRKVLTYFFLNPEAERFVNELARTIDEDPKNVHRKLLELERESILRSEFRGNQRYFQLNEEHPLLEHYRTIILQTVGIEEQIKSALRPVKGIEQAIIYGSYAKGAMDAESDIDVLLIGEHRPREAVKHINPISKQSGRKINLVNMTPEEYEVKRKEPFLTQVLNEKHIRLL